MQKAVTVSDTQPWFPPRVRTTSSAGLFAFDVVAAAVRAPYGTRRTSYTGNPSSRRRISSGARQCAIGVATRTDGGVKTAATKPRAVAALRIAARIHFANQRCRCGTNLRRHSEQIGESAFELRRGNACRLALQPTINMASRRTYSQTPPAAPCQSHPRGSPQETPHPDLCWCTTCSQCTK